MIDTSSGGALMNKMREETWELIEMVADANQHFKTRATNKGVYKVALSESTILAKSLVDIASMLKEIKEGQQPTPTILKHQPDAPQQTPAKRIIQWHRLITSSMAPQYHPTTSREDLDSKDEYEEVEDDETAKIAEEATEEEVGSPEKEEEFFISTIYGGNEEKQEDLPEKCADHGPCFVTCKI
ncbi:hypothetical protein PIB30_099266 [Stylosanthes scabra]|uniref:Uncharacterized protein n=1 Tax=Stylosanthes scabra TaxID=79078 RepID=A0ABU6ZVX2_9FABA|nr:hypothetical protein [Stylosanthes scabra]